MSVEYKRLLRLETQLESGVIKRIEENNDGLFLPPNTDEGRNIFCHRQCRLCRRYVRRNKHPAWDINVHLTKACDVNDQTPEIR